MKISYEIVWIKRAKTPSMMRARVLETHTPNPIERALGARNRKFEREWVGCEIWHQSGKVGKVRAPKGLENYLSSRAHIVDTVEEAVKCHLPRLTVTFGRN